jgi:alpha-galactosidase
MPILIGDGDREFHLRNAGLSYIVRVHESGHIGLLHFGAPLATGVSYAHLGPNPFTGFSNGGGDLARMECPGFGCGDFRLPALVVELEDGSRALDPVFAGHRTYAGKEPIPGLPSTYVESDAEAESLELTLVDRPSGVRVVLKYSLFRDYPVVARSMVVENGNAATIRVLCAMSASVDLPDAEWELLTLSGGWARECKANRRRLVQGTQGVYSLRGASSHQHNPFMALLRPGTTEDYGEAYGLGLVYSGNFLAEVEVDAFGIARARIGIHPEDFSWELAPGQSFRCPEAVLAFSSVGLGGVSESFHALYRDRLARGSWRDRPRPILINNWEGTYWDFSEDRLLAIARASAEAGIELFVLDDGWFGERNDDTSSLGDWRVNERKLPGGLAALAERIEAMGMKFGLWIEPEMVSPRSELFRSHPDWAIGIPGRPRTEGRNQYVLDLSRTEVVDRLHETIRGLLSSVRISYLKWDMNRNITEPYSQALGSRRQGEFFHRYILGLYDLLGRITREFPELLVESCAGGGGRFDPGMLAFAPQAWVSDDTDAVARLAIQWGTSICYPLSSMGAHVSTVPNHQVGRVTPFHTRAAVSFFGVFGYELDATALGDGELAEVAEQVALYKAHRDLLQHGKFLRIKGPFEGDGNETAWMCASADASSAVVGFYRVLTTPAAAPTRIRLRGLDPRTTYRVSTWPSSGDPADLENEGLRGGDELLGVGLSIGAERGYGTKRCDAWSRLFFLEAAL